MSKYVNGLEKVINFNISFTNKAFCILTTDAPDSFDPHLTNVCIQHILRSKITKSNFTADSVYAGKNISSSGTKPFIIAIGI